jgi:hypothetical protein
MSFQLLHPGPLESDDIKGDNNLLERHELHRIARHVLSDAWKIDNYLKSMQKPTDFRK